MNMKNKRGVSEIIVVILLVLITIAAVAGIYKFLIPMIKENMERGKSCYDLKESAKIIDLGKTCYNSTTTTLTVQKEDFVENMAVSINVDGKQLVFNIDMAKFDNNVTASTFQFNVGNGKIASLYALDKNKNSCLIDTINLNEC